MKRYSLLPFIIFLVIFTAIQNTHANERNWSVLIYMEPMKDLHDAAWRNLNDLAGCTELNDQVDISVQLHSYDNCAWRYKIKHGVFIQDSCVELTNDYVHDITDAARWAYSEPANHALIFWGHGHGILMPTYNPDTEEWELEDDDTFQACLICKTLPIPLSQEYHCHKAILLNNTTQKCLDNHQMITILETVTDILDGKRIDVVGMDVCLGASLEHAYQIAPYADYLVACQNCELPDGFDHHGLARALSSTCSPL